LFNKKGKTVRFGRARQKEKRRRKDIYFVVALEEKLRAFRLTLGEKGSSPRGEKERGGGNLVGWKKGNVSTLGGGT